MAKIGFVGFGEVNTPVDVIVRKCKAAEEALKAENAKLKKEISALKKEIAALKKQPLAKTAHEEVVTAQRFEKTGDKGLDRLARFCK